jgi:hypothetical protein
MNSECSAFLEEEAHSTTLTVVQQIEFIHKLIDVV